MNSKADETRRDKETSYRKSSAAARIAMAFTIVTIALSVWPNAYFTSNCLSARVSPSGVAGDSRGGGTKPQDPTQSTDRDAAPKRPGDVESGRPTVGAFVTSPSDYRIGISDIIEVRVDKAPELSGMFRVSSTGTILMNFLGNITAKDKTPEELARFIADGLRGEYLKDPHVVIEVKQYNSRAFFVQGSVRNPGLYHIEGLPSLLKLLIIAGGLADNHGSTAFIIREIKQDEVKPQEQPADGDGAEKAKYELIKCNINGLLKGAFDQDILIEPGDVVNIPSSEVFFVAGEVNAPGSFPLKEGTSLRQALSLAQGTTPNASLGRSVIFREDTVTGKRQEISVDISDVMKGKKADIQIMPNDTIIIPNSRWKSFRNTLLQGFGYGFIRTGRMPGRF
jgi:polysaccharide export outer membrane protein